MSKIRRDKVSYLEYTFNIFEKYGTWQISFKNPKDNNKIVKRSTKLEANSINLAIVKKDIIPSIVEFLSGKVNIDIDINYEEILLNDFSESYCKNRSELDTNVGVRPDAKTEFNRTVKRS